MFCGSCGAELPDNSEYCKKCGCRLSDQKVEDSFENKDEVNSSDSINENDNSQNYQTSNEQQYNGGYANQPNNGQFNNVYGQYNRGYANQGYGSNYTDAQMSRIVYKRKVLPFKLVAAIMNLISTAVLLLATAASIGYTTDEFYDIYIPDWLRGFEEYGIVGLIVIAFGFVLVILGVALPAKGGVVCNLINTIAHSIIGIWGMALSFRLLADINDFVDKMGGLYDGKDAKNGAVGLIAFCIFALMLQFISLIMSIIGLTRKKDI